MTHNGALKLAAGLVVRPAFLLASLAPLLAALPAGAAENGGRRFPQAATPSFWRGVMTSLSSARPSPGPSPRWRRERERLTAARR